MPSSPAVRRHADVTTTGPGRTPVFGSQSGPLRLDPRDPLMRAGTRGRVRRSRASLWRRGPGRRRRDDALSDPGRPGTRARVSLLTSLAASTALVGIGIGAVSVYASPKSSRSSSGAPTALDAALAAGAGLRGGSAAVNAAQDAARVRQLLAQRAAAVQSATRAATRQALVTPPAAKTTAPSPTPTRPPTAPPSASSSSASASVSNSSATAWAHSPFAVRVANCESGGGPSDTSSTYDGNPHLRAANGHYGKWQFALGTWWGVGGTGNPADASESEQDYRAWLLWQRDGWSPWQCASMV